MEESNSTTEENPDELVKSLRKALLEKEILLSLNNDIASVRNTKRDTVGI